MRIDVRLPRQIHLEAPPIGYDESLDDIRSILGDLCLALEQEGEFTISGFGQDRWPVDVGTDLLVLLEQLPALLRSLACGRPATLEFYEQGIQRNLVFTPAGDDFEVVCESYADWQPNPRVERVRQGDLLSMLQAVQHNFMEVVRSNAPELASHPWVLSWLKGQ